MIGDNVRVADLVVGDMEAQIAACHVGAKRFLELIARYGETTLAAAVDALLDYSERLMRQQIETIPDGTYTATGTVDGFLDSSDPSVKNLPVCVSVTVAGSDLTVDLEGTAPQVPGHAINMPFVGTVDVAIWLTLRSVLLDSEIYGSIPQNDGLFRPIKIRAPLGCIANPVFPAPTIARFAPGNVIADTLMHALACAVPELVSAGVANLKAITFTGMDAGRQWVHIEIFEGSYGGRFGKDGMDCVDTLYANTRNNPIEDIESHVPLRVTRYEFRDGACAAGKWRGGLNSIKEIEFLSDGALSVEGDGHGRSPWGFQGGADGLPSSLSLLHAGEAARSLPSMLPTITVRAGDRVRAVGGIGGGYGKAFERDPQKVAADVLDGYLTAAQARELFGVCMTSTGSLDDSATRRARAGG
jgi:N-methylhydantoinase B